MPRQPILAGIAAALLLLLLGPSAVATPPEREERLYWPLSAVQAHVQAPDRVLLVAFVPDGYAAQDVDEAIALGNAGANAVLLNGYQFSDGEGVVHLPGLKLEPGEVIWCAREATAFFAVWGQKPACEYDEDTDPTVPDAGGKTPRLANSGDELFLRAANAMVLDTVVYAKDEVAIPGWQGESVPFYSPAPLFSKEGQVFYRLRDAGQQGWLDSDGASDWAQGNSDPARGRRLAYPGWQWQRPATHVVWSAAPPLSLAITPDNGLAWLREQVQQARRRLWVEIYELSHPDIVQALVERARAGVDVRVLLEGGPASGLSEATRWAAGQISAAGGQVAYMVNDVPGAHDRYAYIHAKFAIIDDTLLLSTENWKREAFPLLPASGYTEGRRGYAVAVSDPTLAAAAAAIFQDDLRLEMPDILPYDAADAEYGAPAGYTPPPLLPTAGAYRVRYPAPVSVDDARQAWLFSAPERSLSPGPLLDYLAQAGAGDMVLVQGLYEQPYWGPGSSSPARDPNPRLQALLQAARRGATVRLLLDSAFDRPEDARSNAATQAYVAAIAAAEGLDIEVRRGNPTGAGVHAKLHLLRLGASDWVVLSSINGSETSNKLNRELGLAVESASAYAALQGVFWADWATATPTALPARR